MLPKLKPPPPTSLVVESDSGVLKYHDVEIFKTRMANPAGTLIGERMQKALSIMEIDRVK